MFPPIATVSPLFLMVNAAGLRDTLLALILPYATFSLPLAIWLLASFFRCVPRELYSPRASTAAPRFGAFVRVVLPLAAPGLVATGLLVFIFAWNEFLLALTFTATEASRTVPVGIALFPGLHEIPYGEIAAASVVVTLPLVVLVFVFQRRSWKASPPARSRARWGAWHASDCGLAKRFGAARCSAAVAHDRRRRVLHLRRSQRLRQVDAAHLVAGVEPPRARAHLLRRVARRGTSPPKDARRSDGVPELRALSASPVHENVAFPLRVRGVPAPRSSARSRGSPKTSASKLCWIASRASSPADSASASRSARARAPAAVFLMDEPLSNLDARLRLEMREEIKRLHEAHRVTTVYVTHDQEEAMVLSSASRC